MKLVTGCSGIDAIAYAATLLDIDVVGQIEIDDFCNKILELRYPGVKRLENLFDVRGDEFGAVDIFAAGIPCQPFSHAGQRKGSSDDRYLWPEAIRIIQVMRPTWVIIENVDGIGSMEQSDCQIIMETETDVCTEAEMVLETIRRDLEEAGYESITIVIPAAGVGTPHQRYRYFIVGHARHQQLQKWRECAQGGAREARNEPASPDSAMGNSKCSGLSGQLGRRPGQESADGYSGVEVMADTEINYAGRMHSGNEKKYPGPACSSTNVAHTSSAGQQECNAARVAGGQRHNPGCSDAAGWARAAQPGMGGNADGLSGGLYGPRGQEDSSGVFTAFETIFTATLDRILWPAGYGAEQYPWEPPRAATGVKKRTNRLKALGNSIVWQQIFPFLLAIKLIDAESQIM